MRILSSKLTARNIEPSNFSLFFLKGNDERPLSLAHQNQILELTKGSEQRSSFLLYNPLEVTRKIFNWQKQLPWIKPHYAVKANPCPQILDDLQKLGTGFDCASRSEIETQLKNGVPASDIVYSNSIKEESDLQWAEKAGIRLTTADSIDQIKKIQSLAPNMGIMWRISIKEEQTDNLATPFSGKFGDDLEDSEKIHNRMKQLSSMGVKLKGIHFHCGSGHHGSTGFGKAVLLAKECMKIGRKYGHQMSVLDIGGGFPNSDLNERTINDLKVTEKDPLGYRVIAEPGRHISGHAFYLLTRVIGKRIKNNRPCYHVNDSLYHSFNCNLMDGVSFEDSNSQFYASIDSQKAEGVGIFETENSTVFGMTCDGMDVIAKNIAVPKGINVNDWFCIAGMGAYTYGCKSSFNGMQSTDRIVKWPATFERQGIDQPAFETVLL